MAIIKCKMCGGDLNIAENNSVAVCEYCGTQQTVPSADNEKKLTLFGRANRLRMACEFDKAAGVYESIVADFPEEAEAYWGLVLCKYGIEYVDDPATGKKIPTCHRSSFDSVMDDSNLEQALENADVIAQKVYREEAKQFERIRKGILEVSSSEKPYDIFICYKETDEKGDRTLDSVMAQDLYAALTDKGYRVFFSRITLQCKLGEAYEPYIFAALNSAKVMLAVGTCYEHYNAVWVKNEWSRYVKLCEADKSKHLIPCYKDLDPEDMPKEFRHLQGADLGKMGAVQDILFNMEKYIPLKKETVKEPVVVQQTQNTATAPLLKRAFMFLEDGEWERADDFCEQVLNIDPECAEAYLGKLMAELQICERADLKDCAEPFNENSNYKKAVRFADGKLKNELNGYIEHINARIAEQERIEEERKKAEVEARLEADYQMFAENAKNAKDIADLEKTVAMLKELGDYKDSHDLIALCYKRISEIEKIKQIKAEGLQAANYASAKMWMSKAKKESDYSYTARLFSSLGNFKDSAVLAEQCREKAEEVRLAERRTLVKRAYDNASARRDTLTEQHNELTTEQQTLQTELVNLKGLFSGKRRKEIEGRLPEISKNIAEIDAALKLVLPRLAELEREMAELGGERELTRLKDELERVGNVEDDSGSVVTVDSMVKLFVTNSCKFCKQAEMMLQEAGIVYEKLLAENNGDEIVRLAIRQAPTLVVGDDEEKFVGVKEVQRFIERELARC